MESRFWMFWEILLNHSHSGVNLLPVEFFKNWFFFEKPICFWNKSPNFPLFWEILTYSVAFYRKVATFSDFKNTLDIFWKNAAFFQKPKFSEILLIRLHPAANFSYLSLFKKSQIFIEKPIFFFKQNQFLNVLRNFINSVAFCCKFSTFSDFF